MKTNVQTLKMTAEQNCCFLVNFIIDLDLFSEFLNTGTKGVDIIEMKCPAAGIALTDYTPLLQL